MNSILFGIYLLNIVAAVVVLWLAVRSIRKTDPTWPVPKWLARKLNRRTK
jgi:hypothetical protein